jgi:GntR family transcriptional regulator, rspAB operon transcriptional repressor
MENNYIDKIYENVRSKILSEDYKAGYKLSENVLAEEYECSRTPIREVFQRLANDGLVVIKPKSGTYVQHGTKKEYVEIMQVRAYLEALAFHLCLSKMTDREISQLEKIKQRMDALIKTEPINMMRYAENHYAFHLHIVKSARNDLLLTNFERLNLKSSYLFYQVMDREVGEHSQDEHEQIVRFLKSREPKGIQFMRDHMLLKIKRMYGDSVLLDTDFSSV